MKRVLVFTGPGKGKTTAAIGLIVRATSHNLKCLFVQFIKKGDAPGETDILCRLGVHVLGQGLGFIPPATDPRFLAHKQAAHDVCDRALSALKQDAYDVVVLDEACTAVSKALIGESEILGLVHASRENAVVVLTGRGASPGIIALADTVSEILAIKHGFQDGIAAQIGVEY